MRSNKKGFTIVELVIVIAVIAILAAVLIPTIAGLVKKANVTKDTQLVRNLNTAIMSDKDNDKTMAGALASAAKFGYDIAKINASAVDNEILWDSESNLFCYLNAGKIEYIPESNAEVKENTAIYWIIDDEVNANYSTYLINVAAGSNVTAKHSIDVTACENVSVTYEGSATIAVYLNGGDLTVKSGTVKQYGNARYVDVADGADFDSQGSIVADLADIPVLSETEKADYTSVATADELKTALANSKAKIILTADITVEDEITASNANVFNVIADTEINLNGHNITAVRNAASGVCISNSVINVQGCNLILSGYGTISLKNTGNNMGWNNFAAVASVDGSGSITVNDAVILQHLGGTDMAYAVDVRTNGTRDIDASLIVNGGLLESTYRAIRAFCNSTTNTAYVTINGGIVRSVDNNAIWMQDPDSKTKTAGLGCLKITGGSVESNGYYNGDDRIPVSMTGDDTTGLTKEITGGQLLQNGKDVTNDYK